MSLLILACDRRSMAEAFGALDQILGLKGSCNSTHSPLRGEPLLGVWLDPDTVKDEPNELDGIVASKKSGRRIHFRLAFSFSLSGLWAVQRLAPQVKRETPVHIQRRAIVDALFRRQRPLSNGNKGTRRQFHPVFTPRDTQRIVSEEMRWFRGRYPAITGSALVYVPGEGAHSVD